MYTNVVEIILTGVFAPVILFFVLGILTVVIKSNVTIPQEFSTVMAVFLIISIGLEGGKAFAAITFYPGLIGVVIIIAVITIVLGSLFVILTANILIKFAKFKTADAWAVGGHYGAVSSVTLAVGIEVVTAAAISGQVIFTGWIAAMYPFMDISALLTAIILGRIAVVKQESGIGVKYDLKEILSHDFFGLAVGLLISSLLIGIIARVFYPQELENAMTFFDGMFRGVLAFFLIDMGMFAATRIGDFKNLGANIWKTILIAFILPQVWGLTGALAIFAVHLAFPGILGWGDAFVFATIAGGASFITAPAAIRLAIPQANPLIYLPMSIALTFPFNIILGMPFWQMIAMMLWDA